MNTQNLDCFHHLEAETMETFRREKGSSELSYNDHHRTTALSHQPEHRAASAICAASNTSGVTSDMTQNGTSFQPPTRGLAFRLHLLCRQEGHFRCRPRQVQCQDQPGLSQPHRLASTPHSAPGSSSMNEDESVPTSRQVLTSMKFILSPLPFMDMLLLSSLRTLCLGLD